MVKKKTRPKRPPLVKALPEIRLDLGCGQSCTEGFLGVDIAELPGVVRFDLFSDERWPWQGSSVTELRASHFIEHLPMVFTETGKDLFFHFFDEAYRVAKHGAVFNLVWPALQNVRAFMDPTHRRFIPAETMLYLSKEWRELNKLDHYQVSCNWVCVSAVPTIPVEVGDRNEKTQGEWLREKWGVAQDFVAVLKAVKP